MSKRSVIVAYILWLCGGWLGVHHLYIGRDRQAFVWWCTCGGVGLGWIRDLWRIPDYVNAANEAHEYMDWLTSQMRDNRKPAFSTVRWAGELGLGTFFGFLVLIAIPENIGPHVCMILQWTMIPPAIAIGVNLIGNIGHETGSFKWTLLGVYVPLIIIQSPINAIAVLAISSSLVFNWTRKFKRRVGEKKICNRVLNLSFSGFVILCLWSSYLYYNASVVTVDGDTVYVRDAVYHFLDSPFWQEFKETLHELFKVGRQMGWRKLYSEFIEVLDPQGEVKAYKVLQLQKGVSRDEITKQCRSLSKRWHPDRHRKGKAEAQEMFIKVQEACQTLFRKHT